MSPKRKTNPKDRKADNIINEAILSHGGKLYDHADYTFIFREKEYRFTNQGEAYTYQVKNGNTTDILSNGILKRYVGEKEVSLSSKDQNRYRNALNSVIYFATLPHKLKDKAVYKKFIETTTIKGSNYDAIEVTFDEKGGGEDHEDTFYYWVNQSTRHIDYLAYSYKVNNGGIRFRSAFNRRAIGGITFQDYVNWKAEIGTPLKDLPKLFEQNKLKEVSQILTENIINHKK